MKFDTKLVIAVHVLMRVMADVTAVAGSSIDIVERR